MHVNNAVNLCSNEAEAKDTQVFISCFQPQINMQIFTLAAPLVSVMINDKVSCLGKQLVVWNTNYCFSSTHKPNFIIHMLHVDPVPVPFSLQAKWITEDTSLMENNKNSSKQNKDFYSVA